MSGDGLIKDNLQISEIITPEKVAQKLLQDVFEVHDGEIDYRPEIKSSLGPWGEFTHSALAQLYFTFQNDLVPKFSDVGITDKKLKTPYPNKFHGEEVIEIEKMDVKPGEIIEIILQDEKAKKEQIDLEVSEKIKAAKRILLTGCVSGSGACHLIEVLHEQGFKGILDIIDISSAPLAIINSYAELFNWKEKYGIEVKTQTGDLRRMEFDNKYEVIISDVIGHWISDQDIEMNLGALFRYSLKENGLVLVRDLEEGERVEGAARQVGRDDKSLEFQIWLKNNFNVNVEMFEIERMRRNLFPNSPHDSRFRGLVGLWEQSFFSLSTDGRKRDYDLIYVRNTVPFDSDLNRIFSIMVVRRNSSGDTM